MTVIIDNILTESRNPEEHGYRLEGQTGKVVHVLGDGWILVEFKQFQIKVQYKEKRKVSWRFTPLQWYIHEKDLVQIQ